MLGHHLGEGFCRSLLLDLQLLVILFCHLSQLTCMLVLLTLQLLLMLSCSLSQGCCMLLLLSFSCCSTTFSASSSVSACDINASGKKTGWLKQF